MSEILIRLHAKASGDIVTIQEDDWTWGGKERAPNFSVIKLPGVDHTIIQKYQPPATSGHKHPWQIKVTSMPSGISQKLQGKDKNKTGHLIIGKNAGSGIDIKWLDFREFIHNKVNNKNEKDNKTKIPPGLK